MKPFLTLLLSLTLINGHSQTPDPAQQFIRRKCKPVHAQLPMEPRDQHYPLLFDSIDLMDARSDTSRVGLALNPFKKQVDILMNDPVTTQLTGYMNNRFSAPTAKHRLLVVVKKLWVSNPDSTGLEYFLNQWNISIRFEAYLSAGAGYIPLTYLDTTAIYKDRSPEGLISHDLPDLIAQFMYRAADRVLLDDRSRRRVISYAQIDSFARSRFNYAMDTATTLVRGVYTSVDEFRDNAPSILKYEIFKGKDSLLELLIPDENGQMYYTHKAWGFCDGQHVYVMMDGNVFPVFSVGHQFYVLGSKEFGHHRTWMPMYVPLGSAAFIYGAAVASDKIYRKLRLFRLDTRSGVVGE